MKLKSFCPAKEEKKEGTEKIFEEIIVENFPNTGKEIVNQVQEVQRVPYRINLRRNTPRNILIKVSKIRYKKNIKSSKGKATTYKGIPKRLTADLSPETLQGRREWQDIFKVMKGKHLQPRLLYPARISFRFNREMKNLYRQAKSERIQHHQTSFTTNAKGTSLGRKHKRRKRPAITNPKQLRKW